MLTILFDGIAYGMVLFVLACGLSVTLGLMNFVNLAHGAFAMAGGYVTVVLMQRAGMPFLACPAVAFMHRRRCSALLLERTLYVPALPPPHLDQVLFTIGLAFMSVAAIDWLMGAQQQIIRLPDWLQGRIEVARRRIGRYRLFIIVVCGGAGRRAADVSSRAPGSAAGCAPRWTMRAWRAAWASASTRSSPSRSRSAPAWRASAARWARRSSASTRPSR